MPSPTYDQLERFKTVAYNQLKPEEKLQLQWLYKLGVPLKYALYEPWGPQYLFDSSCFCGNWDLIRDDFWLFPADD